VVVAFEAMLVICPTVMCFARVDHSTADLNALARPSCSLK